MSVAVVDASFLVALLTSDSGAGAAAYAVRGVEMHAPALIRFEVAQVLRRFDLHGGLEPGLAERALATFMRTEITEWPFGPLASRVWELRAAVSAYDASYIAVAELLGAPLLTFDRRLSRAPGVRCEVVVPA